MSYSLPVSIDIVNKNSIDSVIANLSKKYSLDLSLPLSSFSSLQKSISAVESSYLSFLDSAKQISSLLPSSDALLSLQYSLRKKIFPIDSPLNSPSNSVFRNSANSITLQNLASQHSFFSSLSPDSFSALPDYSGYQPSGAYVSALDQILSSLNAFHALASDFSSSLSASIDSLTADFHAKLNDPYICAVPTSVLQKDYDDQVSAVSLQSTSSHIDAISRIYDLLKFWLPSYYQSRSESIPLTASLANFAEPVLIPQAVSDAQSLLLQEKSAFDDSAVSSLVSAYHSEMAHLASLQSLNLIKYDQVVSTQWEYFRSLKSITSAKGDVSQAENDLLDIFRSRAKRAQLLLNKDGSDITQYYNQVKFLDSSYYEWKKARIKEDVEEMQISEDQKAKILKQGLDQLEDEQSQESTGVKPLFRILGVDKKTQDSVVQQYQMMASQISSIWSQMYANLDSQKDSALKNLEKRAKNERKSEAWLAAEKDKINAQYEKKARAMRKTEQKMQIASGLMNTYEGVTNALTTKPAWLAPILAASIGTLGLVNVGYIAAQKFARGGTPEGLFRGVGTTTSDSNIIAISDQEYIIAADRVRKFGVGFFDAINFGNAIQIRNALGSVRFNPLLPQMFPVAKQNYNSGGYIPQTTTAQNQVIQVTLKCDSRVLAKAVTRGNKKIIRIN